ncbi:hypothetical protein RI367_003991 [Sorochytrium milnesiophthora]
MVIRTTASEQDQAHGPTHYGATKVIESDNDGRADGDCQRSVRSVSSNNGESEQSYGPQTTLLQRTARAWVPKARLRWVALSFCCLLLYGNYYAYDNPSALSVPLHDHLGISYDEFAYQLNLFYAVYSLPNIFLTLLSGPIMDRYGIKSVLLVLSTCVCTGQFLFAIGVQRKSFSWMLAGRVLFGIGGESIGVAQASITTAWFKNKELAFALGFNLCVARLGSVTNSLLSPYIYDVTSSVPRAIWVGFAFCLLSFVATLVVVFVIGTEPPAAHHRQEHDYNDRQRLLNAVSASLERPDSSKQLPRVQPAVDERTPLLNGSDNNTSRSSLLAGHDSACQASNLHEHHDTAEWDTPSHHEHQHEQDHRHHDGILATYKKLPVQFYLLCIICILLYGTVVPFNTIASEFLQSKWFPGDPRKAGVVMSIPDTISAFLVPLLGTLIDRYGRRCTLLIACSLIIASSHAVLGLTMIHPLVPLFSLGLSYSLYGTAMWPSFACVVTFAHATGGRATHTHEESATVDSKLESPQEASDCPSPVTPVDHHRREHYGGEEDGDDDDDEADHLVATAYGIATSALNASLTVVPIVIAWIMTLSNGAAGTSVHSLTMSRLLSHGRHAAPVIAMAEAGRPLPSTDPLENPFFPVEMFFVGLALTGTAFTIILYFIDQKRGQVLQLPHMDEDGESDSDDGESVDNNESARYDDLRQRLGNQTDDITSQPAPASVSSTPSSSAASERDELPALPTLPPSRRLRNFSLQRSLSMPNAPQYRHNNSNTNAVSTPATSTFMGSTRSSSLLTGSRGSTVQTPGSLTPRTPRVARPLVFRNHTLIRSNSSGSIRSIASVRSRALQLQQQQQGGSSRLPLTRALTSASTTPLRRSIVFDHDNDTANQPSPPPLDAPPAVRPHAITFGDHPGSSPAQGPATAAASASTSRRNGGTQHLHGLFATTIPTADPDSIDEQVEGGGDE